MNVIDGNDPRLCCNKSCIVFDRSLLDLSLKFTRCPKRLVYLFELLNYFIKKYNLRKEVSVLSISTSLSSEHKDKCSKFVSHLHSNRYLEALKLASFDPKIVELEYDLDDVGLSWDCAVSTHGVYDFAMLCCQASFAAAQFHMDRVDETGKAAFGLSFNWFGGWHHAQPDRASGFCYLNDCAVAISYLLSSPAFQRVCYVDLDLHQGDGVERMFRSESRVTCISLHLAEPGFFPPSSVCDDIREYNRRIGKLNVPLPRGIGDDEFLYVFTQVWNSYLNNWQQNDKPRVLVVQCGADGLLEDSFRGFRLTDVGYMACLRKMVSFCRTNDVPMIVLGGGGYNAIETAKLWTLATLGLSGEIDRKAEVDEDFPLFLDFMASFELATKEPNGKPRHIVNKDSLDHVVNCAFPVHGCLSNVISNVELNLSMKK